MSPLVTLIVNMGITLVLLAILVYGMRWLYLAGFKDGQVLARAEARRDLAEKQLEETRKQYPPSYAVSE